MIYDIVHTAYFNLLWQTKHIVTCQAIYNNKHLQYIVYLASMYTYNKRSIPHLSNNDSDSFELVICANKWHTSPHIFCTGTAYYHICICIAY